MDPLVEFLSSVIGERNEDERIELRLKPRDGEDDMSCYFFKTPAKVAAFALKRRADNHVFFGAAPRVGRGKKENVKVASSVWVDIDRKGRTRLSTLKAQLDSFPLPPTYVVATGGGYHAYWALSTREPSERVERTLKVLRARFRSDHVTDCSRVMRLPFTTNFKYTPPRKAQIEEANTGFTYELDHLITVSKMREPACNTLRTGDVAGFQSRSERDFSVMAELRRCGGDITLAELLFSMYPIGDRFEESGMAYLERTFESASEFAEAIIEAEESAEEGHSREFVEFQDCYYVGQKRISTFVLDPLGILEDTTEDALVCDVRSRGFKWDHQVFPRRAFTRGDSFQRFLPFASWQWLGTDKQVRALMVQLVDELFEDGNVPKMQATSVIGRHDAFWVTPGSTISVNGAAPEGIQYVRTGKEAPIVQCTIEEDDDVYRELLSELVRLLPMINRPETVLPLLSWYTATPQKPLLEKANIRFPVLMLFGTRGSGKTSVVQDVFQPLIGYEEPRSYDCATTKFSMLALLGSTNAVPISFKEFRADTREGEHVQRMVRMAYDVGYDVRGKPDQTTVNYPLTAPLTLDGEDIITDPAAHERMVPVNLRPETIAVGSESQLAFDLLRALPLERFVGRYIQFCLEHGDKLLRGWKGYLDRAHSMTRPVTLPARIASNYGVLFYGMRLFQAFLSNYGLKLPGPTEAFRESLNFIFDTSTGRTALAIDELVADIINDVAVKGGRSFAWRFEEGKGLLWFHLTTAHNWWLKQRRFTHQPTLGKRAIKQQLRERKGDYVGAPKTKNVGKQTFWMYPVNVKRASAALDTPYPLVVNQFVLSGASK